ncbi:MAG: hypothetical protein Q9180_006371, partial [Flavoplaca navasiana]
RLEDLDVFDGASRGAWGGLELLWKINIRQIASLGALLVVVGLPVAPLSQQSVHYDVRNQPIPGQPDTASLLTAISWNDQSTDDGTAFVQLEASPPLLMKAAILNGLYAGTTTINHIQPTCPGGNCTYPDYRSLAICTRSADVSSHLKSEKAYDGDSPERTQENFNVLKWYLTDYNYLISNGTDVFSLGSAAKNPTQYDELDFSQSIAFKDSSAPIADVFMIYARSRSSNDDIAALEFLLEWCVQSYTTTVTNGTATTERHDAVSNFSVPGSVGESPQMSLDHRDFTLAPGTLSLYQKYFRNIFRGKAWREGNPTQLYVSSDATQALFQPVNIFGRTVNGKDDTPNQGGGIDELQKILDNIAVAMTNVIRTNYNKASTTTESNPPILGSIWVQETYVTVQWGWLAAPITLLVGSVLFVLGVIISSLSCDHRQRPEVWKSSNLPLLKALEGDLYQEGPSGMKSPRSMEEWAKEVRVRLTRDADGDSWKLVRH